jgi:hypothetical protein
VSEETTKELASLLKELITKGKTSETDFEDVVRAEFRKLLEKVAVEIGRKS